jgi:hypothetical protein
MQAAASFLGFRGAHFTLRAWSYGVCASQRDMEVAVNDLRKEHLTNETEAHYQNRISGEGNKQPAKRLANQRQRHT